MRAVAGRSEMSPGARTEDLVSALASGLCAQIDPEVFFPSTGQPGREARRVCAGCSVRAECLEWALRTDQRYGIWGGLSETQRRTLRRVRAAELARAGVVDRAAACAVTESAAVEEAERVARVTRLLRWTGGDWGVVVAAEAEAMAAVMEQEYEARRGQECGDW